MTYVLYQVRIQLLAPFSTLLVGDTFFGQLCWAAREVFGEPYLNHLLEGYTNQMPWLVASDGFPANYLPKPTIPYHLIQNRNQTEDRKKAKLNQWLPLESLAEKLELSVYKAVSISDALDSTAPKLQMQMHNSINRLTGTTGEGFAPFVVAKTYYSTQSLFDIYLVADDKKMQETDLSQLIVHIGNMGYGKDASTGLGKFELKKLQKMSFNTHQQANAYLTLAPCAPQKNCYNPNMSFWRTKTKFGRHGNIYAAGGQPFKAPMMLAQTAGVFSPKVFEPGKLFIGQGLGGDGSISKADAKTIHQGYAPVVSIAIGQ